ncbi:MAG: CARDB domain-containing protein [Candidatus Thermoplasmatota archaeon]
MKKYICLIIVGLFLFGLMPIVSTGNNGRPLQTPDGLYWADDKRVSDSVSPDEYPQISVNPAGDSLLIWIRSGNQYMFKKIDRMGNPKTPEKFVATASPPRQHNGQISYKVMDIDSKENVHVLLHAGYGSSINVQRYTTDGVAVFPAPIDVASSVRYPHQPALAVTPEDKTIVAYEYYPGGRTREPVGISILSADGKVEKQGIPISEYEWYIEGLSICTDREGNIHAMMNVWYGAQGGVWHSKLDKYGNRPPMWAPTYLYTTPSYSMPIMPVLAVSPDLAVHIAWPSSPSGGYLNYIKLDKDGNIVNKGMQPTKITESPTMVGKSPGIATDSKNRVYLTWADNRDSGLQEIYYARIEPGEENETPESNRLTFHTGIGGYASDPNIAIDPEDNVHVVWTDTRDGNKEIYYKFAFNFAIDIGMTPQEILSLMFIRPLEVKTANVTVRNIGGMNDTMYINVSIENMTHVGWTAWLEAKDENNRDIDLSNVGIDIAPGKRKTVKLCVKGPPEGMDGDYILVHVIGTSKGNPLKNDTITLKVQLQIQHLIVLKCAENMKSTPPNVPVTYIINIQNLGDVKEDILLYFVSQPFWDAQLETEKVTLDRRKSTNVNLTVKPPSFAKADELGVVTVTGKCVAMPTVKSSVTTKTIVGANFFFTLTIEDSEKWVYPGETAEYIIFIENYGNVAGIVIIILEIVTGTGDWSAELDATTIGIKGGERSEVRLTVTPPDDAMAGERLVVKVVGYNEDRTLSDDASATTCVKKTHKLKNETVAHNPKVYPGETAKYTVTLSNYGNADEIVQLTIGALELGWSMEYIFEGKAVEALHIRTKQSVSFGVLITVPSYALAGTYYSVVAVIDTGGSLYPIALETFVEQIFNIDITTTQTKLLGTPGKLAYFTIIGRNFGNGVDTIVLTVNDLPPDWKYELRDVNFEITDRITLSPAGETGRVTLIVSIPKQMPEFGTNATYEFYVEGYSKGAKDKNLELKGGAKDGAKLAIEIILPDLYISKVEYDKKVSEPNKVVTIHVSVSNDGTVSVEDVVVSFYEGDKIVDRVVFDKIAPQSTQTATFTWMSKEGNTKLGFVVDADNAITETSDDNNKMTRTERITGKGKGIIPGFEGFAIMIAFVLFVLLTRKLRRC